MDEFVLPSLPGDGHLSESFAFKILNSSKERIV